jgi:TatD DNase family protein
MAVFYDTHAHIDYQDFQPDFADVLQRARAAGITKIISIGTDLESSRRAIALAEEHEMIYAVVGWHPSSALDAPGDIRESLREFARHPKVVALGETGLDFYRLPSAKGGTQADDDHYKRRQTEIFSQHLEVAAEVGLNCVIHQRGDCLPETLAQMKPFVDRVRGVFHCFAGDVQAMGSVVAQGSIVSFTGIVTFKNGDNVRETAAATPLDKLMLETDCPYLTPEPNRRRKRCEPADVKDIAEVVAKAKGCSLEELSKATCATAHEFFPKMTV